MSKKHEQTRWTDSRARREVEAWKRSGESMAAYARKHGYPAHRLSWWQKRLAREAEAAETTPVEFAPAVITGARRSPVVVAVGGDGVRLEVGDPGAVHPGWLAELATALRSGATA